jgi:RNA recognition motif-containing protein
MVKFGFEIVGMKLISNRGFGYVRFSLEKDAREVLDYYSSHPIMVAGKRCHS